MYRQFVLCILVGVLFSSCTSKTVFVDFDELNNGSWGSTDTLKFNFQGLDSTLNHHIFFNVRNDEDYPFSNLFVIAEFKEPNGRVVIDTLEYKMAEADGNWLGKGVGSIKESKLWYQENIKLGDSGVYMIKVTHAMRENGQVQGLSELKGITDFGVQIQIAE